MLTPEDKTRIEEEEQYRANLRAQTLHDDADDSIRWKRVFIGFFAILGVLFAVGFLYNRSSNGNPTVSGPGIFRRYEPVVFPPVTGQFAVNAGQSIWRSIVIPADAIEGHVSGNFSASGGLGNDIQAAILDQPNLTNWVNGHQAQVFWTTPGPETVGSFDLRLNPGTYYLAFSNRQAVLFPKQVTLTLGLSYKKPVGGGE